MTNNINGLEALGPLPLKTVVIITLIALLIGAILIYYLHKENGKPGHNNGKSNT